LRYFHVSCSHNDGVNSAWPLCISSEVVLTTMGKEKPGAAVPKKSGFITRGFSSKTFARIDTSPGNPLHELVEEPGACAEDFLDLARTVGEQGLSEFVVVKGKKTATAIHLAMRSTSMTFDRQQLNELIGIDPQLLTRPDQYGATPLHHYLRNCVVPSSEFVRLLHEKMVDVPAVGAAATEVKQDGSKLDVGIACRNAWGMTPVMDLMENPNLFRSSTTTDESVLRLFETIDELDDEAFVRAEPYNGFSACHYLFSTAKLSPSLVETLLKCDPTALERATTGTGEPKTPVRLLLSNSNETMDVFLRLAPVFPGILEDVVSIMYSGVLDRPGSPGQMLEPLVKSTVEKHAAEVLVRKVISLQLFSHEDAAHVLSHSNDSDLDDSDDDENGNNSPSSKHKEHALHGAKRTAHREWMKIATIFRVSKKNNHGPDEYKNVAKFMLMLIPLKDPKKFHGWVPGKGLYMMARVFEAVETAIAAVSATKMDFDLGTIGEQRMKIRSDAWVDACTEFAICMVADKGLIQGMVLHAPPAHALEKIGASSIMKLVIDEKYMAGPVYAFYLEFGLYILLLYCVTIDLSLWSGPTKWSFGSIVVTSFYFTWRLMEHMLLMRSQELDALPTKLGFDKDREMVKDATPFKILFRLRYRTKFLQGNDGLKNTHYFEKKSYGHLVGLFFTTYLGISKAFRQDWWNWATLLGLCGAWMLVAQVLIWGEGVRKWGVVAGFLLWLEFFRRLKGTSIQMATFVLMLQRIVLDVDVFVIVMVLVMLMFGSLFRIILHRSDDIDDDQPNPWNSLSGSLWIVFLASLGEFQEEDEPNSLFPTHLLKVLFIVMSILSIIVLMNVLIAIISESFTDAVAHSERIFYGARIDLLHSLGNAVGMLSTILPKVFYNWLVPDRTAEELKSMLAPKVIDSMRGSKAQNRSRLHQISRRVREEVRHSSSRTIRDISRRQNMAMAGVHAELDELRALLQQLCDSRSTPADPIARRHRFNSLNSIGSDGASVISATASPTMLSPWNLNAPRG
jgi:hypothetical protein